VLPTTRPSLRRPGAGGLERGKSYPHPIVDHKAGRERALRKIRAG
jgi:deoxyribodipyrimidine photolyase